MRNMQSINDGWLFLEQYGQGLEQAQTDERAFVPVRLPHTSKELPLNNFDERESQLISCYRRHISVAPRKGRRVFLHFEGVMAAAKVFFNGKCLTEHLGGYTPFTCELTGLVTGGDDVIAVVVDARERDDIPPFGYVIDYLTYGGIYREVWLEETEETLIANAHARTEQAAGEGTTSASWMVETDVDLDNLRGISGAAELAFTLTGPQGETSRHHQRVTLDGERRQTITVAFPAGDVRLWDLDTPNLYELTITLSHADSAADAYACRIGFRTTQFRPDGFYLNGRRVKLRGLNRHQSYPYVGYAMPSVRRKTTRNC